MCCIWQDDKRLSWFRSEWYKRSLRMYWYSARCLWAAFTDAQGPGLHQGRLWAALCPTFSCVTVLYKDLFVPEERSKKLFRFFAFSLAWKFVCVHYLCVRACVRKSEIKWVLCGCFLFVYIPPLYEKAKATNVICILFFGHSWSMKCLSGHSSRLCNWVVAAICTLAQCFSTKLLNLFFTFSEVYIYIYI